MVTSTPGDVTQLLADLSNGDEHALARMLPLVYEELRSLADRALRCERQGHTLQTTALLHEAFLKLVDQRDARWQNRAHFFGVAAQLMRRILVDHARAQKAAKRGGGRPMVSLDEAVVYAHERAGDLLALDEALVELARIDSQQARIVELRFFGGLTIGETAEVVGISPATVKRDWTMAKTWLRRELLKA